MNYNQELNILLVTANKSKKWLAAKMGIKRQSFWRKVSQDKFTDGQKKKIEKLLEKHKVV